MVLIATNTINFYYNFVLCSKLDSHMRILIILTISLLFFAERAQAQVAFQDVSALAGINNIGKNTGVAVADYDNDGDDDVYISQRQGTNLLYQNDGNGTFTNVAAAAGVAHTGTTTMSVWGDIDNDGHLDLFLGNRDEPNVLFHNQGDGTFQNISFTAGVSFTAFTKAVLFGDVDRDGLVDIYVANVNQHNQLLRNNGNLTFTDIVHDAGANDQKIAMGSMFFDYDGDGDLDLYLTHDAEQPFVLLQNDGTGRFTDVSESSGANYAGQGMGTDFGDFNGDGLLDIYITNLYENTLLLNQGDGTFADVSQTAGVTDIGMGWGTTVLDCDNDGWQDIYLANDSYFFPNPNVLYRNRGDNTFENWNQLPPINSLYAGYGVACGDFNQDGKVDLFLANSGNDGNQLFLNQHENDHHWVQFKTIGTLSNRAGIGTSITLEADGRTQVDEVCAGSGYASQNSLTLHFGLGETEQIDRLTVRWPNGLTEVYEDLVVDQKYILTEGESIVSNTRQAQAAKLQATIFPNPASETITVDWQQQQSAPVSIQIFDLQGHLVQAFAKTEYPTGIHQKTWSVPGHLPKGVYHIQLAIDTEQLTLPVVLQR